jgi:hypothetical protein
MKVEFLPSPSARLSSDEIRDYTYRVLGKLFVVFSSIEFKLASSLGNAMACTKKNIQCGIIGKLSFQDKLDRLLDMFIAQYGDNDERFCKFLAWYMAVDSMRETRNRFAHGRWGFLVQAQSVAHVAGYPDGLQDERRYSLAELHAIVADAELLDVELNDIMREFEFD